MEVNEGEPDTEGHPKRSARLRYKSAKGNKPYAFRGEDFIYCEESAAAANAEENFRKRSSSWSIKGRAKLVTSNALTQSLSQSSTHLNNSSGSHRESYKDKQTYLRQERIDILFKGWDSRPQHQDFQVGGRLSRSPTFCKLNHSIAVLKQQTKEANPGCVTNLNKQFNNTLTEKEKNNSDHTEAGVSSGEVQTRNPNQSEITKKGDCNNKEVPTVKDRSKDAVLLNAENEGRNGQLQEGTPQSKMASELQHMFDKFAEDMRNSMKVTVDEAIEASMTKLSTELKDEIATLKLDKEKVLNDLQAITTSQSTITDDLAQARRELDTCKLQLAEVRETVIKQDQMLDECRNELDRVKAKISDNILKIRGIKENEGENCIEKVKKFFKDTLGIEQEMKLYSAYRIRRGKNRTILIELKNARQKGLVFANVSKLAELPFSIDSQVSGKKSAARRRNRHVMWKNKKDTASQLIMSIEKQKLIVDGMEYQKQLVHPSTRRLLHPTVAEAGELLQVEVVRGDDVQLEGQTFIGYTACVKSVQEANSAYAKVRTYHTDARHVICACKVPGTNHHTNQDWVDDDEHGGGDFLMELMDKGGITNRVLFVVRYYDGTHIGTSRFDAMYDAIKSVMLHASFNSITQKHQRVKGNPRIKGTEYAKGQPSMRGRGTPH